MWRPILFIVLVAGLAPAAAAGFSRFSIIDADIRQVAAAVSAITGRPVVLQKGVSGLVSMVSDRAGCDEEVVDLFLNAVWHAGWGGRVEPSGQIVLSIAQLGARGERRLATRIYSLQGITSAEVAPQLRALLSAEGRLAARDGQTLVVDDYASQQCAVASMLEAMGQSNGLRLKLSSEPLVQRR